MALALLTGFTQAAEWKPVKPAELAESKPQIDPEAGAEILLREVELDQSSYEYRIDLHRLRIKIYTQAGVDLFSKIDLPYSKNNRIDFVTARTTRPDGSVVELNANEVYDREVIKSGDVRAQVKSFSPPGLVPGAVVEYTYSEFREHIETYVPLFFQIAVPARKVRFRLKLPALPEESGYSVHALSFNCPNLPIKQDGDGFFIFELSNQAASQDEPFQPPATNTNATILVYYKFAAEDLPQNEYWGMISKKAQEKLEFIAKPTSAIQAALAGIGPSSETDAAKLQKIYDYCRTKIIDRYSDASGLSAKERKKLKPNENASDTLKTGNGSRRDINVLFAALARAAGFDARFVACNNRKELIFQPQLTVAEYVLPHLAVAVKHDGAWQYFDPGSIYLPAGMLPWFNTYTEALISDSGGQAQPQLLAGPPAAASTSTRKGNFTLAADGTLEGDVTEAHTGYREADLKAKLDDKAPGEREELLKEQLQRYQKLAEITQIVMQNASSPTEPLKISYHLRIPQYADKTGTRLFFQPAVFQKNEPPKFVASTRRKPLIFPYSYTTIDEICIKPPENWTLEDASAPGSFPIGTLGNYSATIGVRRKSGTIVLQRKFSLNSAALDPKVYPAIKGIFEEVQKKDGHTLTLKQVEPAASNITGPAP